MSAKFACDTKPQGRCGRAVKNGREPLQECDWGYHYSASVLLWPFILCLGDGRKRLNTKDKNSERLTDSFLEFLNVGTCEKWTQKPNTKAYTRHNHWKMGTQCQLQSCSSKTQIVVVGKSLFTALFLTQSLHHRITPHQSLIPKSLFKK